MTRLSRRGFLGVAGLGGAGLLGAGFSLWEGLTRDSHPPYGAEARAGWRKYPGNPVLGPHVGTCFDVCLLRENGRLRMWFSWRDTGSIALTESLDGVHWSRPRVALAPTPSGWEDAVNRPAVLRRPGGYHLWYTGQAAGRSAIGHALSMDGVTWTRDSHHPVLRPSQNWERVAVMCPDVLWNPDAGRFEMWYSGGDQNEPNAIGYAVSRDGIHWDKPYSQPIFRPSARHRWERKRVTACQVVHDSGWYVMFYIGFENESLARIGLARSRDGIHDWQRHPLNPILQPSSTSGAWDYDAVYKPFAIRLSDRWLLWYNGRRGEREQIGLAVHSGLDLGFEPS